MELSKFKRILTQVMVIPVLALLALAGILFWQIQATRATVDAIERTDRRIAVANLLGKLTVDEETGLRGYQTTGDPRFLEPFREAEAPIQRAVNELRAITAVDNGAGVNLTHFVEAHRTWHDSFADPLITFIAAGGSASDVTLNLQGKQRMDAARASLDTMIHTAEQRRVERIAQWNAARRHVYYVLVLLAVGFGLFIGLFTRDRLEAVSVAFRRSLEQERRRAEQIFLSEQNLRTTLASIGDGVITCNADGTVRMMNLVAQELTGWTEAEAQSLPLTRVFNILNESTRQPVENPVDKVKRLNRIVGLANHTILVRKDGAELNIDDSGSPIRNEAGDLTGVVLVFRDITVERKTRAALLANEKLAVAGRLAATIAHEIHNPLDSVSNLIYLLQQGCTPEETRHFLDLAHSELSRVTQISRAMLSLYREAKAPVPVNLKEMLEDLLLLMERRLQDLGVAATADLPAGIIVDGFPAELRQVFTNLIMNAAEAAGRGGFISVRVTPRAGVPATKSTPKVEPGALVQVIDSGPGISPETLEHLFEPFFTTKGEQGTGLGLWVSQGIIRKHAGTLTLNSDGQGPTGGTIAQVFLASKPVIDPGGD